jgi:hypothetical protein
MCNHACKSFAFKWTPEPLYRYLLNFVGMKKSNEIKFLPPEDWQKLREE